MAHLLLHNHQRTSQLLQKTLDHHFTLSLPSRHLFNLYLVNRHSRINMSCPSTSSPVKTFIFCSLLHRRCAWVFSEKVSCPS